MQLPLRAAMGIESIAIRDRPGGFNSRSDRCSRSNRAGHGSNEPSHAPNRVHAHVIRRFNKYEFVASGPSTYVVLGYYECLSASPLSPSTATQHRTQPTSPTAPGVVTRCSSAPELRVPVNTVTANRRRRTAVKPCADWYRDSDLCVHSRLRIAEAARRHGHAEADSGERS